MTTCLNDEMTFSSRVPGYLMTNPEIHFCGKNNIGGNDLLGSLSPLDIQFLIPNLESVHISVDQRIYSSDEKISYAYFPTTAIVALVHLLTDGSMSEIAVVGHDGMLGMSAVLGEAELGAALVQHAGHAYRIGIPALIEACEQTETLRQVLMRYAQVLAGQIAQNAVSSRHFSVDRQLSRWLLIRLDRLPTNALKITQMMIAAMLGVRRESISAAVNRLQQYGLIQNRRGSIIVLDRCGLEDFAGECYQKVS